MKDLGLSAASFDHLLEGNADLCLVLYARYPKRSLSNPNTAECCWVPVKNMV